ncbi:MAG: PQQ-dependent sugar dehydrogenase [Phycisphaerales bacterium]
MMNALAAVAGLSIALGSFAQPPAPGEAPGAAEQRYPLNPPKIETKAKYKVETVAEALEVPWGIAFLPDGRRALVTERAGRVRMIEDGTLNPVTVFTVPDVESQAEKGLMGVCIHPRFAENNWVYLAYGSTEGDIRVVRYTFGAVARSLMEGQKDPGGLKDEKLILRGMPARNNHAGCRIKFGPDGKLYVTTGEMFRKELAQDMTSLGGKVLRLNDDGTVPDDNPFTGEEHASQAVRGEIWAVGVRNPQGIDWDPKTGLLWETEHGPSGERGVQPSQGGDELNIIEKGKNYGWPEINHDKRKEGMETPVMQYTPAIAPASGAFYTGDLIPEWKGNYFFGALGGLGGGKRPGVVRVVVDGRTVTGIEWLATEYGRIREVVSAPDGSLWFTTSNKDGRGRPAESDDRVLRFVPE